MSIDELHATMKHVTIGCVLVAMACTVEDVAAVQRSDASTCGNDAPWLQVGDVPCDSGRSRQFRAALCSCEDSVISAPLITTLGTPGSAPWGAAVGWNGRLDVSAPITIAGSFINGSAESIVGIAPGALTIAGNLEHGGPIEGTLDLDVGGDVRLGGSLQAQNVAIAGTLSTPMEATIAIAGTDAAPRRDHALQAIAPPCACDVASQHDIAAIVSAARDDNDNTAIALVDDVLANVQADTTLALPCGRFYLDRISAAADVTLTVQGHVALFVAGDVALEGALTIDVQDGALDLFVAGNLTVMDALTAGGETEPVRVYVGGAGTLNLGASARFGGFVYAPRAELVARQGLQAWGPVFVRRISSEGEARIHYDGSAFDPGQPLCE